MFLTNVLIENYKSFERFELELFDDLNIIVGDNETGKSTILEAINLALTGYLHGRPILYELTPYLFNANVISTFLNALRSQSDAKPSAPRILIELYFKSDPQLSGFKGMNNTHRRDVPGVKFTISLSDDFREEYQEYITSSPDDLRHVPIEYYCVEWFAFDGNRIGPRKLPINVSLIDATNIRNDKGADGYVSEIINDLLSPKESAQLKLQHRKLKEKFETESSIDSINAKLAQLTSDMSDKQFSYSVDLSGRAGWESTLATYLDGVPFRFIGKGEQTAIKTKLALHKNSGSKACMVLLEEPENHLSFSSMCKLINKVTSICDNRQLIITTHSSFVLNKLGLEKLILISRAKQKATLKDLSPDTQKYFKALPGYDTLRVLLAERTFLVEGPSDELIVQKAYLKEHGKLPIENGDM
jgi:putative ATP-dependent endonuclease of the OLD family